MKKTFKIVILATTKKANLSLFRNGLAFNPSNIDYHRNQLLYIISDEEIKEGDWYLNDNIIKQNTIIANDLPTYWKKIIASTDNSINQYWSEVNSTYKNSFKQLPQIPESFVKAYIKAYNEGNTITEVDLEVEQFFDNCPDINDIRANYRTKTRPDNTIIIHESKTYSKGEVLLNMQYYMEFCKNNNYITPKQWLEDNKHF